MKLPMVLFVVYTDVTERPLSAVYTNTSLAVTDTDGKSFVKLKVLIKKVKVAV
jgi:hypothetical protein